MVTQLAVRQGYRFYAAVLVLWSAFSVLWAGTPIDVSATTIGYGWVAIAIGGTPVAIGLYATRTSVFEGTPRAVDRFVDHSLSGWPLGLYAAGILVWSVVFVAWIQGALTMAPTVLAYGWFLIAIYGAVLTIGLVSLHREKVMDALRIETRQTDRM